MGFKEKCKLCRRKFTDNDEFKKHLKLHPFSKPCEKCDGVMKVQVDDAISIHTSMKKLLTENNVQASGMYLCEKCGFIELYAIWS